MIWVFFVKCNWAVRLQFHRFNGAALAEYIYLFLFGCFSSPQHNSLVLEDPIRTEDEELSDSSFFCWSPCHRQAEWALWLQTQSTKQDAVQLIMDATVAHLSYVTWSARRESKWVKFVKTANKVHIPEPWICCDLRKSLYSRGSCRQSPLPPHLLMDCRFAEQPTWMFPILQFQTSKRELLKTGSNSKSGCRSPCPRLFARD